jgi:hypothetical protein
VVNPATGTWYLRNENSTGSADAGTFQYGGAHWGYVTGQWQIPAGPGGMAELAAGSAMNPTVAADSITNQQLQQMVAAALIRVGQADASPALLARLESTTYEVGQLSSPLLGYTYARRHTVVIDANAEGYGWFVRNPALLRANS